MIIHCFHKDATGTSKFRADIAERLHKQETFVNPTLHVGRAKYWKLLYEKELRYLSPKEEKSIDDDRRAFDTSIDHSSRMIEMGVNLITGSDSSWGDYKLGNTVYEAECLVMAGLSPMKAIMSVTSNAAKALDVHQSVGTIEPGKLADLIVIDGDPSKNIEDLWNVSEIFFDGKKIHNSSKSSLLNLRQPRAVM
jgi:hypothetical protein